MTAVAEPGEPAVGLGERIGTITLVKGSIVRMRRAGLSLVGLWLGLGAATTGGMFAAGTLGVDPQAASLTFAYLAYAAGLALISAIGGAVALRLLIEGPGAEWFRTDRRFVEGTAALGALAFTLMLIPAIYSLAGPRAQADSTAAIVSTLLFFTTYLLAIFAYLRLSLWPAARVAGRAEVGPAESWRLMKKATRGLVLGYLLFAIPLMVLVVVLMQSYIAAEMWRLTPATLAMQFAGAGFSIASYGMVATIFALRIEAPAGLADVFD